MSYSSDESLKCDIIIPENTTWSKGWKFTSNGAPFFTSSATVKAQVRERAGGDLLHTFNAVTTDEGVVLISVYPNQSVLWNWLEAYYDVLVTKPGGDQLRLVEGRVCVSKAVSR